MIILIATCHGKTSICLFNIWSLSDTSGWAHVWQQPQSSRVVYPDIQHSGSTASKLNFILSMIHLFTNHKKKVIYIFALWNYIQKVSTMVQGIVPRTTAFIIHIFKVYSNYGISWFHGHYQLFMTFIFCVTWRKKINNYQW